MFNKIISGKGPSNYLSTDHDLLFRFHRWRSNLRILEIDEFQCYFNGKHGHSLLDRVTPENKGNEKSVDVVSIDNYQWKTIARGLFDLPIAA